MRTFKSWMRYTCQIPGARGTQSISIGILLGVRAPCRGGAPSSGNNNNNGNNNGNSNGGSGGGGGGVATKPCIALRARAVTGIERCAVIVVFDVVGCCVARVPEKERWLIIVIVIVIVVVVVGAQPRP